MKIQHSAPTREEKLSAALLAFLEEPAEPIQLAGNCGRRIVTTTTAAAARVLLSLLSRRRQAEIAGVIEENALVDRIVDAVHEHITTPHISLTAISRAVARRPAAVSGALKNGCGCGFYQFVKEARISRAIQIMAGGSRSVKEACYEVGYTDVSLFCRHFKQVAGVPPSQFLRATRSAQGRDLV